MTPKRRKRPEELRSHRWYGADDIRAVSHRGRSRQLGYAPADFAGKPVIGVVNTWSDMNTCHGHFRERAEQVKRGVLQAGGFPVELPAMSLGEIFMKPSTMLYRNLLAMEAEELLRSYPIDGAVMMCGCDKTTPALFMAAATMDLPTIFMPAGPMLRGFWRGQTLGSGTDVWKNWADRRAGALDRDAMEDVVAGLSRSAGICMTMGTAATMTAVVETLGLTLPGASSIPAVDSAHAVMAAETGRRIVEMVWQDLKVSDLVSPEAFDDAIVIDMALGGSTNAVIHLLAMAGRCGFPLDLRRFDEISRATPMLADIKPSGRFLMEDFYYAGGLRALLARLRDRLHLDRPTCAGLTFGETISQAEVFQPEVIRPLDNPVKDEGGTAILFGTLAPDGAVIKQSAADPRLSRHTGPAVVFRDYDDLATRIDDPALPVTPDSVLVLQNCGPIGAPGMPEWGMLPLPKKLLQAGVRDMVRISDARMSGTSYGTCVLHVAPEAHVGGPLAFVRDGDLISLDVAGRRLDLAVDLVEMERRRAAWQPRPAPFARGYGALFAQHVTQANRGCDFDFLAVRAPTAEPAIH
jgi:dihydroxy-acid dehydratase